MKIQRIGGLEYVQKSHSHEEGFFFGWEKKLVTFSYDRWHCTQANLEKYANQNPIKFRERNWGLILHFSVVDICMDE